MSETLAKLFDVIQERRVNQREGSYTVSPFAKGQDEIVKEFGEEAIEVIVAAKGQGRERIVSEAADLIYHLLGLLADNNVVWNEVEAELGETNE